MEMERQGGLKQIHSKAVAMKREKEGTDHIIQSTPVDS